MNGFIYAMPWALPGPIGTFIDTNFQPISLLLTVVLLVVDFVIYYPFCKAYDNVCLKDEAARLAEDQDVESAQPAVQAASTLVASQPSGISQAADKPLKVLVRCAGAGTSALLANALADALADGAKELGIDNLTTNSGAYGNHYAIMDQYDVIVLAPQVRTYYNDMKADTDRLGITPLSPRGKEYIDLTNDPKGAIDWLYRSIEG